MSKYIYTRSFLLLRRSNFILKDFNEVVNGFKVAKVDPVITINKA